MRFGWVGFEAKCPLPPTYPPVNMAGGEKRTQHLCSRAQDPDLGSSAPDRAGSGRESESWRQPASAQQPCDGRDHRRPCRERRRERRGAAGPTSSKGRAPGGRPGRAGDGAEAWRRWHDGVKNWRGERLESFEEDAPRGGGRHGRRLGGGSESGIGDGADRREGERRAGERPLSRVARRARSPRLLQPAGEPEHRAVHVRGQGHLAHRGLERGRPTARFPCRICSRAPSTSTQGCAYASFASQKAGVAFIKLDIVSASRARRSPTSTSWSAGCR